MIIEITPQYLVGELQRVGVHPASLPSYQDKAQLTPLKLFAVSLAVANKLKEEMVSLGGDAVVGEHRIDEQLECVDVILLGTRTQYELLEERLEKIPDLGLEQAKIALKEFLFRENPPSIQSPWGRVLNFQGTQVMGIINITSDSFFAQSRKQSLQEILVAAEKMIQDGASILDLGGMSTRPGSNPVSREEEAHRIVQAVKEIRRNYPDIMVSVDTYRADVAQQALEAGADIINDISGLAFDEKLIEVVAKNNAPYILMHIKGTPKDMQQNPSYADLIKEMMEYFWDKINYAKSYGMDENNIIIDPGLGFGKRYEDNMEIMDRLTELKSLKKPILIGASRKSFVGTALSLDSPADRLPGTLAISALCAEHDIELVRVHDVKENTWVIKMMEAIKCRRP